ncbi:hypothetical protein [Wenjunlia tyrosinilytica]|uniref:Uncharacterized protein n=1 Tax=Wenjunlia tyrosinilytica TaxID=1544741 RepID=A0A917ZH04_9ACTN|nr:hypothetical protein [Wenjunlia tyrosinilytica]GGO83210.1 hypothetical protein GCM10012280_11640 [Wenjunlia tyrosinilytica]
MPEGAGGRVAYRALAEAARRLAVPPATGPSEPEADIRTSPWWRVRTLRRLTLRGGLSVGGLLALAFVAVNTFPWWADAVAVGRGPTAVARARVGEVDGVVLPWVLPDNVAVTFRTARGRTVHTAVAHAGNRPHRGETLKVEYATDSPSHASALGNEGLPWGVAAGAALCALCLTRVVWRAVAAGRTANALVRAARSPEAQPVRYVLLTDPVDGWGWLLVFPVLGGEGDRPSHLVPVRTGTPAPSAACLDSAEATTSATAAEASAAGRAFEAVGTADLRGEFHDGRTVVPWLDGRPAWPLGPLESFGPEDEDFVLSLVSGNPGERPQPAA